MTPRRVEGLALRVVVTVGGFVPVGAGLAGILRGAAMTGPPCADPALDSHIRYLSGLLLAIGVAFWTTVPAIERRGQRFRLLTILVVTGGAARLLGVVLHGWPPPSMVFGLIMEVVVTPLLCLWQARLDSGRSSKAAGTLRRSAC